MKKLTIVAAFLGAALCFAETLERRAEADEPTPGVVDAAATASARALRETFLADPTRPRWHFVIPEDDGMPGDPNGCFFANGRYNLMYLYNRRGTGFCWGRLSSSDLVHWRCHPDAIVPGDGDEGCRSGGAFLDDDGTAWIAYWMIGGGDGVGLTRSNDRDFDRWTKLPNNPAIPATELGVCEGTDADGKPAIYGTADPSNIWKKGGKYYLLCGNKFVLDKYGRGPDAPNDQKGDRAYLFESPDLEKWSYRGVFYDRERLPVESRPDDGEDNMCPSFLPLSRSFEGGPASGKYLLAFLSHTRGSQYYIGTYDEENDRFIPESHGRTSFVDSTHSAPEALVDDRGRQIMWNWLFDDQDDDMSRGWRGVFGLPRVLWLGDDETLRMAPPSELAVLRCHPIERANVVVDDGARVPLDNVVGDSFEAELTVERATAARFGVRVRVSANGEEYAAVYYDAQKKALCMDSTRGCRGGRPAVEEAPFEWKEGEPLVLRVFVDKTVVDAFANDRQAITRRYYPQNAENLGVELFAEGGNAEFRTVKAWETSPSNPY